MRGIKNERAKTRKTIAKVVKEIKKKCKHVWQPNFDDRKSLKNGYQWRCFACGRVAKTID